MFINTNLKVFENTDFGKVEIIQIDNKPYFAATKCAEILGYSNPHKAIGDHCHGVTKREVGVITGIKADGSPASQNVLTNFIPEGDLYRLIVSSKLPTAEKFERWIFDEVLPSIRKHGMYATKELLNNPDLLIEMAQTLKTERAEKERMQIQSKKDKPKVLFADAVSVSDGTILIGELAKILKGNSIEIGQNRLFEKLRQDGYLIKRKGSDYNSPTQKSMELELFKIKETAITHSDGHITVNKTTKITGKGQQYFVNYFLGEKKLEAIDD